MASTAKQVEFLLSGSTLTSGEMNDSGRVYFFTAGTTTNKNIYSDKAKTAYDTTTDSGGPHNGTEYVALDSGGKAVAETGTRAEVYADGTYDVYIYDSTPTLLDTLSSVTYEIAEATTRTGSAKTASFNVDGTSDAYYINAAGATNATFTILAAAQTVGKKITIANLGAGVCTLVRNGSDTFNGETGWTLSQYNVVTVESDGTNAAWIVTTGSTLHDHADASGGGNTILVPTIASMANATHDHRNEVGGGLNAVRGAGPLDVGGNFDNLIVDNTSVTETDIDADWVTLYDVNGVGVKVAGLNISLTLSSTPALLSIDTGTEGNKWYHLWVVAKLDGTLSGVYSASSALATVLTNVGALDSDYIYAAYAGAIQNVAGNLVAIYQEGTRVEYDVILLIDATLTASAWTSLTITAAFPPTAKKVRCVFNGAGDAFGLSPRSDGHAGEYIHASAGGAGQDFNSILNSARGSVATLNSRYVGAIYYYVTNTASDIEGLGWEY